MKSKLRFALIPALALSLLVACGQTTSTSGTTASGTSTSSASPSSESRSFTIAHVMSEADPYHLGVAKFAELVEEKTQGQITFEIYANSQLGAERDITEGVSMGTIDMAIVTNAFCVNLAPEMGVLDFPYLFQSRDEAYEILDGEIGDELFSYLEASNIKGLAYMENGFRDLTTTSFSVTEPEQIKGLKIRTMETPIHLAAFNAAGANSTPMAASELFTSLQQKAVDGQENPLKSIYDYKFYEVTPYISLTEHFYSSANLIINLDVWNDLSADEQAIFEECAAEATDYQRECCATREEEVKGLMRDAGCTIVEDIDKEAWSAAMHSVYEDPDMVAQYGDYLTRIQTALGR